ncbi:MAG: GNAT family N-acetyltransferase, partial [Candidatus Fimimonas sp.]
YRYHPPFVTKQSILDDMNALPPNTTFDNKFFVGFFEKERLVAILDLVLQYPTQKTAFVGFFMVDAQHQRKGVGSKIIGELALCLKLQGYKKIRLGVDKGNNQSYSFWAKNNFTAVCENKFIVMEREI